MNQSVGRGMQRGPQACVAVPERVNGNAAHEIEISLAVSIDEIDAIAVNEFARRALVVAQKRAGCGRRRDGCRHAHSPDARSRVPRDRSSIALMSEMRTRFTPPAIADSAASSLAFMPPTAVP